MAAKIKATKGDVDIELVKGARGAFEIVRDGQLVYSKLESGKFPDSDQQVVDLL